MSYFILLEISGLLAHMGRHNIPNFTTIISKNDLKNNFEDDPKNDFKDGLAFPNIFETFPLSKEDVGNHVVFGWTHMCCSVLILVPPF